jgi:molybdopterin-containing oxidoreductase family membrane subunit
MFMLEKALTGGRRYWLWLAALLAIVCAAAWCYALQLRVGLGVTGLSRDVTWGLYIAQFTFFVGVAASAVVVVLPYYLHDYKAFGRVTILGEFVAISAVTMCAAFIFVDMGQPARLLNIVRYVSPGSLMFWDMVALGGYLLLNVIITRVTLEAERCQTAPPRWIRRVILLSIPWAISIHTVTAFLYSGLPGRPFWLTALLAPRFLASAFAAGPALLILLCLLVRRWWDLRVADEAIRKIAVIVTYALAAHLFFAAVELFTVFYGQVPDYLEPYRYLYAGLDGLDGLTPWTWASTGLAVAAFALLLTPATRARRTTLAVACIAVFVALWIEKGLGLVVAGFIPTPLGNVPDYVPTLREVTIVAGIWAVGATMVTVFFKITAAVRTDGQ